MARKETAPTSDSDREANSKDNGFDPDLARTYTGEILGLQDRLDKLSASIRGEINGIYKKAKREANVPINLLKHEVERIRAEQKGREKENELEEEFPGQLEKLREALAGIEDTPLGRAAIEKAEEQADRPRDSMNPTAADSAPA